MTYVQRNRRAEKYIDEEGFVREFISKDDVNKIVGEVNKRVDNLVAGGSCECESKMTEMDERLSTVEDKYLDKTMNTTHSYNYTAPTDSNGNYTSFAFYEKVPSTLESSVDGVNTTMKDKVAPALNNVLSRITSLESGDNSDSYSIYQFYNNLTENKIGRSTNPVEDTLPNTIKMIDNNSTILWMGFNQNARKITDLEANQSDVDTMITEWTNGKKDLNDALTRVDAVESDVSSINGDISSLQSRIDVLENLDGSDAIIVGPQTMGSTSLNTYTINWKNENGDTQSRTLIYGESDTLNQVIDWIHEMINDSVTDIDSRVTTLEDGGTTCTCADTLTSLQTQYDGLQESTQTATSTLFDRYDALNEKVNRLKAAVVEDLDYMWTQLRAIHTELPEVSTDPSALTSWVTASVV